MAKTKLSWIVFVVTGLIVAAMSYILDRIRGTKNLVFFAFIGVVLILYGLSKLLMGIAINIGKPKREYKHTPEYHKKDHGYKYCPKCASKLRSTFNFCYNCGERVN